MNTGTLSISRYNQDRRMRITLRDDNSHTRVVEIEILPEELMLALTALAERPCAFEVNASKVGMKREHKTVLVNRVPTGTPWEQRDATARLLLAPHEVDGWVGSVDDMFNGHCTVGDCQWVTFHRCVPPAPARG